MNFQQFQILGDEIHAKLKSSGFNEEAFPDIAAEALAHVELEGDFELQQIADFLITTKIPQQPSLEFSNLPPVVYRCEEFYIELLIWMDATTTIHQHAFSGAFRVLVGSSFHSVYEFEENDRINSRLLLGEVRLKNAEILQRGDVRPIYPGRSGLAHALFHLERPSVTIVVRSYGEPWNQPQYSFNPPNVAYDGIELKRDSKVRLLSCLLRVASSLNREQAVELLVSKSACLDFPRLFMLVKENHSYLSQESDWKRFMEAAREVHGDLAEHLAQMVKSGEASDIPHVGAQRGERSRPSFLSGSASQLALTTLDRPNHSERGSLGTRRKYFAVSGWGDCEMKRTCQECSLSLQEKLMWAEIYSRRV